MFTQAIVMISPLPTRGNGLLGADLTCET